MGKNDEAIVALSDDLPAGKGINYRRKQYNAVLAAAMTPTRMRAIIEKLVEIALTGEEWAIREVLDRGYGKSKQTLDITSSEEHRFTFDLATAQKAKILGQAMIQQHIADELAQRKALPVPPDTEAGNAVV